MLAGRCKPCPEMLPVIVWPAARTACPAECGLRQHLRLSVQPPLLLLPNSRLNRMRQNEFLHSAVVETMVHDLARICYDDDIKLAARTNSPYMGKPPLYRICARTIPRG